MIGRAVPVLLWIAISGCDLTLTQDRPAYGDLEDYERSAVDRIFARVRSFDADLRSVSPSAIGRECSLGAPAEDRERIDVAFRDAWVAANIGDDVLHLSVWQNLSDGQRRAWTSWFEEEPSAAQARFERFHYGYLGEHLAAIQAVFRIQTVEYVYAHRSVFNLERDAQRLETAWLRERDPALLGAARATCSGILAQFDGRWGDSFDRAYYAEHFRELTDPAMPSGWLYFLCRHMKNAVETRVDDFGNPYGFEAELSIIPR